MVVACCVPFCNSRSGKSNISFHEFPSEETLGIQWITNISRKGLQKFYMPDTDDLPFMLVGSHWLLIENLNHLMEKNKRRIKSCGWYKTQYPSAITTVVFQICDDLEKSRSVKYTAIEILIRYLTIYFQQNEKCQTHEEILDSLNENSRASYYRTIFTSIRIADKLHCMNEHITLKEIVRGLHKLGLRTTYDQMNRLERQMLVTMQFNVNFVIIPEYVETLLMNLKVVYNMHAIDLDTLKSMSITLLDTLYPHIEVLYRQIYSCITKRKEVLEKDKREYYQMKADYCSLALGVIAAAGHQCGVTIGAEVQSNLCLMTGAEEKEVAFFAMNIIQLYYNVSN